VDPQLHALRLRQRAAIVRALRRFLDDEGFLELEPPVLVPSPALEATLEAVPAGGGWLHTSPEFALKKALALGLPRIFALTPCFRDEEHGPHHAREFTLLEFYVSGGRVRDLEGVVEGLVHAAARAVDAAPPVFASVTVAELFARHVPGGEPDDDDAWFHAWVHLIEPALRAPLFVRDYPARHAALAEVRGDRAERVEVYLGGLELGNGFSELRDPDELRDRFTASATARRAQGRAPHPVDEGLLDATARMPRCTGIALGVDRLVMALTGARTIDEVRLNP
jgi:lysyl-tRNA synthetase class 2